MTTKAFPYSTFLRGPTEVLPQLDEGDVLLERRDEENLVLTSFGRFAARQEGMTLAARLLGDVVRDQADMMARLFDVELPWMRWLPETDRKECIDELLGELVAGADTGVLEPFARALAAWRSTAEVWSDPGMARRLQGPFAGDGATIPRPSRDR